jgi:adenine/guanine phosphoribosyltransferase-like PRPP-binding protein
MYIYICDHVLDDMIESLAKQINQYYTHDGILILPVFIAVGDSGDEIVKKLSNKLSPKERDNLKIYNFETGEKGKSIQELLIEVANKLVGVATAGIPISVITTYISGLPSCYTRKIENVKTLDDLKIKLKEYGDHDVIEGDLIDGDNIVIVDDLITDGGSKLIAKELIEYAKKEKKISITCKNVAVVIDREQGGCRGAKGSRTGCTCFDSI